MATTICARNSPRAMALMSEFYRALAASVLDGKPFPVSAQDAVDVMTIIDIAIRSNAEGRRLDFTPL